MQVVERRRAHENKVSRLRGATAREEKDERLMGSTLVKVGVLFITASHLARTRLEYPAPVPRHVGNMESVMDATIVITSRLLTFEVEVLRLFLIRM